MKVSDLKKVQEIDMHIQQLLNELTALYQERGELFSEKTTKKSSEQKSQKPQRRAMLLTNSDKIDFSTFDLSLRD